MIITRIYLSTLTMIPQVKEPKSPNIAPNPLRVILNNLHYEQRYMHRLDNTTLSRDRLPKCFPQFLAYKYFPCLNPKTVYENR